MNNCWICVGSLCCSYSQIRISYCLNRCKRFFFLICSWTTICYPPRTVLHPQPKKRHKNPQLDNVPSHLCKFAPTAIITFTVKHVRAQFSILDPYIRPHPVPSLVSLLLIALLSQPLSFAFRIQWLITAANRVVHLPPSSAWSCFYLNTLSIYVSQSPPLSSKKFLSHARKDSNRASLWCDVEEAHLTRGGTPIMMNWFLKAFNLVEMFESGAEWSFGSCARNADRWVSSSDSSECYATVHIKSFICWDKIT